MQIGSGFKISESIIVSSICFIVFLLSILSLSARMEVVKLSFVADLKSLVEIMPESFLRPLGKVMMTLFNALIFCHKKFRKLHDNCKSSTLLYNFNILYIFAQLSLLTMLLNHKMHLLFGTWSLSFF